jgi:PAS domain S-box-containing protein
MSLDQYLPDQLRSRYAFKLLGISLLIVAVIVSIGGVMAFQLSDNVADEQLRSVEATAELEADALAEWIEGEQEAIRILSSGQGIEPANATETRETLREELDQMPQELAALHVAERPADPPTNGTREQIIASTDPELEGRPLAESNINWGEDPTGDDRQYVFENKNDVILSWIYFDGDEQSVAIASPTHDGDHVLIGEYRTSARAQEFTSIINGTETVVLGGVSAFVVFDSTNPDEFRRYKGDRESTEVGRRILERDDPFSIISGSELDDNEVRGYHSVPAEETDWVVVKEAPRSNALALTTQVQQDLAILFGTMMVGFLLIGVLIQYGPIRAIKRLSRQADTIAAGDLSVEIAEPERIDEVGQLQESFGNTQEYIQTIAEQSEALSQQHFDADVLDEEIPGCVGASMATMRDDLERFITELEAERERYSRLVEQSNDGVGVLQDGQYVFANDRLLEITGYDREEFLGMGFEEVVTPEDCAVARERYEQRMNGDSPPQQYQLGIETSQGEHRTVEVSVSKIDHDGEPAALVNVRDVTERKRRKQRLEIFNRVLRHNLRNDLQVVDAVLEEITNDSLADERAVAVARRTTEELLDTARTARRIERAFENFAIYEYDLGTVVASLEDRAAAEYPDATIDPISGTATVEAASVLEDALWELLDNACKHAGEAPEIDLDLELRDDVAVLKIRDHGPGLPSNERKSIERGEETNLQHANGLGLWLAHWTVEASGGDLSFEIDDGTTVVVTLPLAEDGED